MLPIPLVFTSDSTPAQDPVWEFKTPRALTIVGLSLCGQTFTGSPTSFNLDIVDDGVDVISAAASQATAGTPGVWKSAALGGTAAPVTIAADSVVGITLNVVGGSSPTLTDAAVVVWALPGVA